MTAGDIYTVAGSRPGTMGYCGDSGPATSALLDDPESVAVDSDGDLIIADTDNNRIQMVAAGRPRPTCRARRPTTSTPSPAAQSGAAGTPETAARPPPPYLDSPTDVATGYGNNSLYIADSANNRDPRGSPPRAGPSGASR